MKIEYTKIPPEETKPSRKFFKNHVHDKFVKFVAKKGLLNYLVSRDELEEAKQFGKLPPYLEVHHIRPIGGAMEGVNRFDNLVVMHRQTHKHLHRDVYDPQLKWVDRAYKYQTRIIEVPSYKYVDLEGILEQFELTIRYKNIVGKGRN